MCGPDKQECDRRKDSSLSTGVGVGVGIDKIGVMDGVEGREAEVDYCCTASLIP